ncbi:hypothetical protein AG1IA_01798 [Rhizoctonia solani AG-1 IA]|uniref:Uncharacterized protein n=1 Tax=Thanatephorus cucumeris (strain AG1-IA) TaxID=983506 RepID=L8X547_THACA|nr:hypothetical protein AG1IA_01798 [Rhizoctonia solani AG-1 IA]
MSKRFASFGGPSVPTSSPVAGQSTNSTPTKSGGKKKSNPTSPNPRSPRPKFDTSGSGTSAHAPRRSKAQEETEIQALVRLTLKRASLELKGWGKTGGKFGLQDAKLMVDQVTELDNSVGSLSPKVQPTFRVVSQKLDYIRLHRDNIRNASREIVRPAIVQASGATKLVARTVASPPLSNEPTHLSKRSWNMRKPMVLKLLKITLYGRIEPGRSGSLVSSLAQGHNNGSLKRVTVLHMHQILRPLSRYRHTFQLLSEKIIAYSLSGGLNSDGVDIPESERPKPSRGAVAPTFEETRNAMVLWATEAASIEELAKEWSEMCALEVVGWDKKFELDAYSSDEDEDEDELG